MSLRDLMENRHEEKLVNVPLSEIQKSELNFYELQEQADFQLKVDSIAESIKEKGLIHPITVRKFHNEETGTEYKIVSGHTRFEAVVKNYEQGFGDGTIACNVIPLDDLSEEEELRYIVASNLQRDKTWKQKELEMKLYAKEYEEKHANHEITGKKDEYIAQKMGVSERTVRNYRTKLEQASNGNASTNTEREYSSQDIIKSIKRVEKSIQKNADLAETLGESSMVTDLEHLLSQVHQFITSYDTES